MARVHVQAAVDRADLDAWITFPRDRIYAPTSPWVSPLDDDVRQLLDHAANPFFRHGEGRPLLARDATGAVVARAHVHIDHAYIAYHDERAVFFGFFESINDTQVAQAVFHAIGQFGAQHGCTVMRGPFSLTSMQEFGLLVDGFDQPPATEGTYSAEYYPELFRASGLTPTYYASTYCADAVSSLEPDCWIGHDHRQLLAEGRLRVRSLDTGRLDAELELLHMLINDAFAQNPYFVPLSLEEWAFFANPYRELIDPSLIVFAELDGMPIAFMISVPDVMPLLKRMQGHYDHVALSEGVLSRAQTPDAVGTFMGVRQSARHARVMHVLLAESARALQRGGYRRWLVTWVADSNPGAMAIVRAMGAHPLHRIALYEAPLPGHTRAEFREECACEWWGSTRN